MILNRVNPHQLTSQQMANTVYALLIRDQASTVDRERIDLVLRGEMPLNGNPTLDEFNPHTATPSWGNREPTKAEMDTLRESWGSDRSSRQSQSELDRFLSSIPSSAPQKRSGRG